MCLLTLLTLSSFDIFSLDLLIFHIKSRIMLLWSRTQHLWITLGSLHVAVRSPEEKREEGTAARRLHLRSLNDLEDA